MLSFNVMLHCQPPQTKDIMRLMRDKHIAQLEANLERLIEGAFAHIFGRKLRAQDIALQLARAMENGLRANQENDPRPLAPDIYKIHLHPQTIEQLTQRQPNLTAVLSEHMVALAASFGYRLDVTPMIQLQPNPELSPSEIDVSAQHTQQSANSTHVLERVAIQEASVPSNPQLIVGNRTIYLQDPIINLGRSLDNNIVLDDPHCSRHHAQMRLRFGKYTLFDVNSSSGTFVNELRIREHDLQTGDVILLGDTRLVYLEDTPDHNTTAQMPPVDGDT